MQTAPVAVTVRRFPIAEPSSDPPQITHPRVQFRGNTRRALISHTLARPDKVADIEWISDIDERFDAVFTTAHDTDILTRVRYASRHPLAPVVAVGPADIGWADYSIPSLADPRLRQVWREIEQRNTDIRQLPPIPNGPERGSLAVLGLAYTRRPTSISPSWYSDKKALLSYPLLEGFSDQRGTLEALADNGCLTRYFVECLYACEQCHSSRMIAREVCPRCGCSDLEEDRLVHHYKCGYLAPQREFMRGHALALACPKCLAHLRHYGVDYDKPNAIVICANCAATVPDADVGFICTDCGKRSEPSKSIKQRWFRYELTSKGVSAVLSGAIGPHAPQEPQQSSVGEAHESISRLISVAETYRRPITLAYIEFDFSASQRLVGQTDIGDELNGMLYRHLSGCDVLLPLETGSILCLPETRERVAARKLARAMKEINSAIEQCPPIRWQFVSPAEAIALLQAS